MDARGAVEAALFTSSRPMPLREIAERTNLPEEQVENVLQDLIRIYDMMNSAIKVGKIGNDYGMMLREEYSGFAAQFTGAEITRGMMKTLATIAYNQPIMQSELCKIFSFGDYVISDDKIMPMECASFNKGDIVVTDYKSGKFSGGCTHLHHHPQGISFCAPIEGLEEHFGILTIQADELPEGEDVEFWKAKVSIVAATFGLYVANQNLSIRFQQHSIRDSLTGLFNKRYMEESLRREIFSAARHKTPIGIIMMYPDNVQQIQSTRGRHAVDQLLWELGQRLPNFIRNEDIPCRFEGDVLCVILPGAELKITRDRAEKIRNEISQLQISYGDAVLATTLSLGVSVLPVHATDVESLIFAAQASMQMASNNGGNRVVLADALQQR